VDCLPIQYDRQWVATYVPWNYGWVNDPVTGLERLELEAEYSVRRCGLRSDGEPPGYRAVVAVDALHPLAHRMVASRLWKVS